MSIIPAPPGYTVVEALATGGPWDHFPIGDRRCLLLLAQLEQHFDAMDYDTAWAMADDLLAMPDLPKYLRPSVLHFLVVRDDGHDHELEILADLKALNVSETPYYGKNECYDPSDELTATLDVRLARKAEQDVAKRLGLCPTPSQSYSETSTGSDAVSEAAGSTSSSKEAKVYTPANSEYDTDVASAEDGDAGCTPNGSEKFAPPTSPLSSEFIHEFMRVSMHVRALGGGGMRVDNLDTCTFLKSQLDDACVQWEDAIQVERIRLIKIDQKANKANKTKKSPK